MSDILHNPENDSYGFRISYNSIGNGVMDGYRRVKALEQYCKDTFPPDEWYKFSHWSDEQKLCHNDFWFATRAMAITTRLTF